MDEWIGDTVKRSAITRDTRFADEDEFSPAGVEKIIRSHAHQALLCDIGKARTGLRIFMASAHNSADVKEIQNPGTKERLAKYLTLITANPQRLQPQAMCNTKEKTFVPIFDDDYDHPKLGARLGVAKAGDKTLFSFFPLADGELACTINVNANPFVDSFMSTHGKQFSFATVCCAACGIVTDGRLKCSACRRAIYCGRACQATHWPTHKACCLLGAAERSS